MQPQPRPGSADSAWQNKNGRHSPLAVLWRRLLIVLAVCGAAFVFWVSDSKIGAWPPVPGSLRDHAYQFFLVQNGATFAVASALYGVLVLVTFRGEVAASFDGRARRHLIRVLLLGLLALGLGLAFAVFMNRLRF